jgi:hypothetical protein
MAKKQEGDSSSPMSGNKQIGSLKISPSKKKALLEVEPVKKRIGRGQK